MTTARAGLPRRLVLAEVAGRMVRGVFGAAAMVCAVTGVWLLFGVGWALLTAVPFLLALDARMAGPGAPPRNQGDF